MNKDEFQKYVKAQINEIKRHKSILSEITGRELGHEAELDWVLKNRSYFKKSWDEKKRRI